jgi:hypothetical protein
MRWLAYLRPKVALVAALASAGVGAAWLALGAGCGASYQALYEGEVRFEHCYKLDEQTSLPLMQRRECWREWTQFYTYGQTRDRIEYALTRLRELTARIENPDGGGLVGASTSPRPPSLPAPTNLFESPPPVHVILPQDAAAIDAQPEAASSGPGGLLDSIDLLDPSNNPPGQACMLSCAKQWRRCADVCAKDKGRCKAQCDLRFRICIPKCL